MVLRKIFKKFKKNAERGKILQEFDVCGINKVCQKGNSSV